MQSEIINSTNYTFIIEGYSKDKESQKTTMKVCHKDGISKYETKIDDIELIEWYDENTKEKVMIWTTEPPKVLVQNEQENNSFKMPSFIDDNIGLALNVFISSGKINDEECYMINWGSGTYYFSKNNGTMLRSDNLNNVLEYKEWKFNELTDADMSRPDTDEK